MFTAIQIRQHSMIDDVVKAALATLFALVHYVLTAFTEMMDYNANCVLLLTLPPFQPLLCPACDWEPVKKSTALN